MRTTARARVASMIALLATVAGSLTLAGSTGEPAFAALAPDTSSSLAGGSRHQCAVLADQTVTCWGDNERGQLGDGTTNDSLTPVAVQGLADVVAIDAGVQFTCALTAGGTVGCWGRNTSGSLGDPGAGGFETTPTFANGLTDVVQISLGATHACARLESGDVRCWGDNDDEQLGDGTSTDTAVPVAVFGLSDATDVSAGWGTTCAIRAGGTLTCWGYNDIGLFGDGTTTSTSTPRDIPAAGSVRQVEVGIATSCVIAMDGYARCAGSGPLGDGTSSSSTSFVDVDLPPVLDISVGGEICAVVPDASLWCWGSALRLVDDSLQGAIAFTDETNAPEPVGVANVTAVDASTAHSCAGSIGGRVRCWGINIGGELQIESTIIAPPGTPVPGVTATQVSLFASACALAPDATVSCWGAAFLDFIGLTDLELAPPTPVAGIDSAVDVDTSLFHSCAALADGRATCWGLNFAGELGFPPTSSFTEGQTPVVHPPAAVDGLTGVNEVAVGGGLSCAATGTTASCWGQGAEGQLGNGTTTDSSPTPSTITTPPMTTGVDTLAANSNHACARLTIAFFGIFLHCWGENGSGQLGNGTTADSSTPVNTGLSFPKSVSVGVSHTCAVDLGNALYCWGRNDDGQLGIPALTTSADTPQVVAGFPSPPTQVAAGTDHTCALLMDGTVACWGDNEYRQTGQTVFGDVDTPTLVPGLTGVTSISAGSDATCAVLADTSVTCWGNNSFGVTGASPFVAEPTDMGITSLLTPAEVRTEPIFRPVTPARLLETREGLQTVDGAAQGGGAIRGGTTIEVPVAGRAGLPDDARFAVVNITAVGPESNGFLTAHGCLSPRPNVASLNYTNQGGDGPINLGNETIVELSANGSICIFASSTTEITMDVTAYGLDAGGYTSTTPARLLDTRPGKATADGLFELGEVVEGGDEIELDVRGRAGVGDDAEAAVLYIAAVNPTGNGFVTAHPCDGDPPTASSLNFSVVPGAGGINRGNEVIAPLSDDGTVCLFVSTTTDLTVDVMGSTTAATTYEPTDPARLLETRPGQPTVDGEGQRSAPIAGGEQIELQVGGRAGLDANASLAALNITGVGPTANGFVTAHPCEPTLPLASSLNYAAPPVSGAINGGNEVLAPLSDDGTVCLFVSDATNLTVDVVGSS